jgi:hypothetical protein
MNYWSMVGHLRYRLSMHNPCLSNVRLAVMLVGSGDGGCVAGQHSMSHRVLSTKRQASRPGQLRISQFIDGVDADQEGVDKLALLPLLVPGYACEFESYTFSVSKKK